MGGHDAPVLCLQVDRLEAGFLYALRDVGAARPTQGVRLRGLIPRVQRNTGCLRFQEELDDDVLSRRVGRIQVVRREDQTWNTRSRNQVDSRAVAEDHRKEVVEELALAVSLRATV